MQQFRGALLTFCLFISAYFGSIFLMGPFLWLFFIDLTVFTRIMSELVAFWMDFAMSCFHILTNTRVKVYGDALKQQESFIVTMNHRTRLDWIFWWVYLRYSGCLVDMKIILKEELSKIPGAGWAMQNASFIFIKRRWETDRVQLEKCANHSARCVRTTKYLLFPEGTDFTKFTKSRSDAFADQAAASRFNFVLYPRTTGFVYLCSLLRNTKRFDAVYDFTVAYPVGRTASNSCKLESVDHSENQAECHLNAPIPHTEMDLLRGNLPDEVRYYIRRHDAAQFAAEDEGLASWLTSLWRRKETFLRQFYCEPNFDLAPCSLESPDRTDGHKELDNQRPSDLRSPIFHSRLDGYLLFVFLAWSAFVIGVIWLLVVSTYGRLYFLALNIVYFYVTKKLGGMHHLVVGRCWRLGEQTDKTD